ncbi:ubiquitination network signaling acrB [Lecanosticta acicola]|uniref:Ubiquitination network signaling acrB n=1 Tax=Lecanosticta acicola TaxID=111012 RepID=A0AAI9EFS7_9PEZI|nr:ubiquitination network signaling acrB [Lecanosticta acicola]
MPPKCKAKNAPNQHDKRHENGLAPPGKRIVRQRSSNGQLNAQPNGKPATAAVSPPALPSTGLNQGFKFPRPADNTTSHSSSSSTAAAAAAAAAAARDYELGAEARARDRTPSDASAEEAGPCGEMADEHVSTPVSGDVSPAATMCRDRQRPGHTATSSPLNPFSTILAYYPLRDAIAILILLLSLPPTLVLVIQTLFASLTFVPPTAGLSLSTLPNIKEIFNSSNLGYPALATILFVDLVFWIFWLLVGRPLQAILLDLSQAVIAVSLSGAAASVSGPTYSIATCSIIVCVVHVLRYRAIHLTALDYLRSVLHKMDIGIPFDVPSFATQSHSATPFERGMAFTAIRTILGIHIVSQGITTCIRRTLANTKANEKEQNVPSITKTDTEATAGSEPSSRLTAGHADGSPHSHSGASSDGRPPGQPPAHRESKQRESNSKKKRKQANQVRSQQPLWAAIASTKVTFVKEMEQRDAADDAREAAVMDKNTTNPFASATNTTTDRIWICEVRDTEIYFAVELSPETISASVEVKEESAPPTTGIDKSKPFFMRINGATWSSTRIMSSEEEDKTGGDRYLGEIFGLAPLSSYHCEVVSLASQRVLCSASLITQPAPTAEQAAVPAPSQHQALRPSSPITTLKQSIQSAEAKLNEVRNRSKKSKKDQRAAHADIKREINMFRSKLESSGGVDDKQEKRLQQISQHKNQAEDATASLKQEIEAMGDLPADEVAAAQVKRRAWQSALDTKKAAERDRDNAKAEQLREIDALKSEIAAAATKRDKLTTRNTQRAQELRDASEKQQAAMTAKQKRDFERASTLKDRENRTHQVQFMINQMEQEMHTHQQKGNEAWQQCQALANWTSQPPPGYSSYSTPPTPEGPLPGTNGQISPQANGSFPAAFGPQPYHSPFNASVALATAVAANAPGGPRGRSSSMFSQYSGFTDDGEGYVFEHRPQSSWPVQYSTGAGAVEDRKASDGDTGSGSGSGDASMVNESPNGSNSPRPDAKPFVPSKNVGTIGPPGRKIPQSPPSTHAGAAGTGR